MPKFVTVKEGKTLWIPKGSCLFAEDAEGRLTTNLTAVIPGPRGPMAATIEVEERCATHADRLDALPDDKGTIVQEG